MDGSESVIADSNNGLRKQAVRSTFSEPQAEGVCVGVSVSVWVCVRVCRCLNLAPEIHTERQHDVISKAQTEGYAMFCQRLGFANEANSWGPNEGMKIGRQRLGHGLRDRLQVQVVNKESLIWQPPRDCGHKRYKVARGVGGWGTYPKFRERRALGEGTMRSAEGLGITWRPGDILRTSQASDVGLE